MCSPLVLLILIVMVVAVFADRRFMRKKHEDEA
jgi:uncharacterized membrane protein YqiK